MTDRLAPLPGARLAPRSERLARLARLAQEQLREGTPQNTVRAYQGDWSRFEDWCASMALCPLPAAPDTVRLYVVHLTDDERPAPSGSRHRGGACRPSTVERALASISYMHRVSDLPSPAAAQAVRDQLRAVRVRFKERTMRAAPLLRADLEAIIPLMHATDLRTVRDRALLLLGWACALRRSEIAALGRADIEHHAEGLLVSIRASKGNQTGPEELLPVEPAKQQVLCPVLALQKWIVLGAVADSGPLFHSMRRTAKPAEALRDWEVDALVKRWTKAAGLAPRGQGYRFSAHSLRAGFITQAVKDGRPEWAVMRHSRHKDYKTMQGYIRLADPFKDNPCRDLL